MHSVCSLSFNGEYPVPVLNISPVDCLMSHRILLALRSNNQLACGFSGKLRHLDMFRGKRKQFPIIHINTLITSQRETKVGVATKAEFQR